MKIPALLLLLALPVEPPAPPADDDGPKSLTHDAGGAPICGLGKAFHSGRRAELARRVGEGVMVFRGLPESGDYTEFRQDKTFWYLTGIESPGVSLVIDVDAKREVLFVSAGTRGLKSKESWEGELWDSEDDWIPDLTGFEEVRSSKELLDVLDEMMEDGDRDLWVSMHPTIGLAGCYDKAGPANRKRERDPLDGRVSREKALKQALEERYELEVRDAAKHLSAMRQIKTPEEIEAMRRASRAGALSMIEAMRSTRPGIGEWELDSLMSFVHVREGADGPAYYAIVGSGPNSLVLHYNHSARVMQEKEMLLIDYGCELDHYTTDITRSWPVDGEFTPRMAEMYDGLLAAQVAAIEATKPGRTVGEIGRVARQVLADRGLGGMMPHGVSHWIGLEVHDVGDYSKPLLPGMAFTIEPGIYEKSTNIGIRIEDVVVVTEDGCEVLTDLVPKDRESIVELIRSEGVLDWMDRGDG